MQLVCISKRPPLISETLLFFDRLMPCADGVLVVCPAGQVGGLDFSGRLEIETLDENEVLGDLAGPFHASTDHQVKNLLLRCGIAHSPEVDDEFILFDDDHRPLREIVPGDFVEDGRHHSYFFHHLDRWIPAGTDFDNGQHTACTFLKNSNLPTLSYAAHMPQIIDKGLLAGAFSHFADAIGRGVALDEWSLYFNYAHTRHPERFHRPRPFATLCWPALPTDWEYDVRPEVFAFENFHSPLYEPGRLFDGIPTTFSGTDHARHAAEKIKRRTAIQKAYDSASARLRRRICWLVYRILQRADAIFPKRFGEKSSAIVEHGADPAFWRSYNRWP